MIIEDSVSLNENIKINEMSVGDEFFVRYVPQSRYFQSQELSISGEKLSKSELNTLNNTKHWSRRVTIA